LLAQRACMNCATSKRASKCVVSDCNQLTAYWLEASHSLACAEGLNEWRNIKSLLFGGLQVDGESALACGKHIGLAITV
jgi:hypothetical protein